VKQIGRWDGPRMQKKALSAVRALPETADLRVRRSARRAAARRRAARRADRLRAAIERAAGIYLPDRLHEVRVAAKKLRYALEMVRQVSGARAPVPTRPRSLRSLGGQLALLEQTQDLLGRMHDLDVLMTRTRGVQSGSKVPDLRLSAELDDLVRWLETECRQLHGHYMTSRVRLLEACTRIARAAARAPRRSAA
jgi:CHAD domain-containing protein